VRDGGDGAPSVSSSGGGSSSSVGEGGSGGGGSGSDGGGVVLRAYLEVAAIRPMNGTFAIHNLGAGVGWLLAGRPPACPPACPPARLFSVGFPLRLGGRAALSEPLTASHPRLPAPGFTTGALQGALATAGFEVCTVGARSWKRDLGLSKAEKDDSRALAAAVFPGQAGLVRCGGRRGGGGGGGGAAAGG
jgi:hypothetical protein